MRSLKRMLVKSFSALHKRLLRTVAVDKALRWSPDVLSVHRRGRESSNCVQVARSTLAESDRDGGRSVVGRVGPVLVLDWFTGGARCLRGSIPPLHPTYSA